MEKVLLGFAVFLAKLDTFAAGQADDHGVVPSRGRGWRRWIALQRTCEVALIVFVWHRFDLTLRHYNETAKAEATDFHVVNAWSFSFVLRYVSMGAMMS
jgi:hypothetical protein